MKDHHCFISYKGIKTNYLNVINGIGEQKRHHVLLMINFKHGWTFAYVYTKLILIN